MSYQTKKLKKWTTADLTAWIKTLNLSEKWQGEIVTAIEENECAGQDFMGLENGKDLKESLSISNPMLSNRVFKAFRKIKEEKENAVVAAVAAQNANVNNNNNNNSNNGGHSASSVSYHAEYKQDDGFKLNIQGQSKHWDIKQKVTVNTTVQQVKTIYKEVSGVGTPVDDIVLLTKGKTMDAYKTLGQIGIKDERHLITVKFKTVGGMANNPNYGNDEENRKRRVNFKKYKFIKASKKDDCLMGYDDDDNEGARAEIGCPSGHAMVATTMYKYIKQQLERNIKTVTVPCPLCKHILDWDLITAIADMNGKEYARWTNVIEQRLKPPSKQCPHCKAECEKKQGVIIFRMYCTACGGPDWCWNCLQKWTGSGLIYCSNANCKLIKDVNTALREAPLITPKYLSSIRIPDTRACPQCLTFIQHKEACKHMTCVGCTGKFCFVCLGVYDKEKGWPCNDHTYECNPAPVQVFK